jgi:hypothetical protein
MCGEYLTDDALEGFGDFKIGAIHIVKYADDPALLVKKQVVLQGMIERQIIDHCFEK